MIFKDTNTQKIVDAFADRKNLKIRFDDWPGSRCECKIIDNNHTALLKSCFINISYENLIQLGKDSGIGVSSTLTNVTLLHEIGHYIDFTSRNILRDDYYGGTVYMETVAWVTCFELIESFDIKISKSDLKKLVKWCVSTYKFKDNEVDFLLDKIDRMRVNETLVTNSPSVTPHPIFSHG